MPKGRSRKDGIGMLRKTRVETGWVTGVPAADPRITAYRGIPFAAPPVGENRWRAPQPASPWEGERLCYSFGPMSMQAPHMSGDIGLYEKEWLCDPQCPMDEDCLYLNVWTPAMSENERLPVLVWYFGGGLMVGAPNEMEFDGERLARRGIVVVTVNYRTNVFGFLAHPDLTREAPDAPTNFGHLDQQFATRWVQRNIAAFGGDPQQITIAGQSAGGGSVQAQLTSPQNEGLCQRAIIDSGLFINPYLHWMPPTRPMEEAERQGIEFLKLLGVSTIEEARKLSAVYVRDKMLESKEVFGRVIDGQFCVDDPWRLLMQGKCLPVPVLTGWTKDEFHMAFPDVSGEEKEKRLHAAFGEYAGEFQRLCGDDGQPGTLASRSMVNLVEAACRTLAQVRTAMGMKTYVYAFEPSIPGDNAGCFHSCDLWFFFETLAKCWRPFKGKHYDLARQMCNYWADFIKRGDPNGLDADGETMPYWMESGARTAVMRFGDRCACRVETEEGLMRFLMTNECRLCGLMDTGAAV